MKRHHRSPRSTRLRPSLNALEVRSLLSGTGTFASAIGIEDNDGSEQGIAVDSAGDTYVTGFFDGSSNFNPSGTKELQNTGNRSGYLAKYSPTGALIWADLLASSSTGSTSPGALALDGQGNVYVTGSFSGTTNFNPNGTATLANSNGYNAGFVAKYDTNGNYDWADEVTPSSSAQGLAIAVDSSGNVFAGGSFSGTVSFGPGIAAVTSGSIYTARYTSAGVPVWAEGSANNANATVMGMTLDGSDDVYTTGYFNYSANFAPGSSTGALTNGGGPDIFVTKLTSSGAFGWAGRIGGAGTDTPGGIVADSAGNVFLSGTFQRTADLDPGPGTTNATATTSASDAFVDRINSAGNLVWDAVIAGSSNVNSGNGYQPADAIAVDSSDNVYFAGSFTGTADFDPSAATFNLTSGSNGSMFVERLNAAGTFGWASATTGGSASVGGVGVDSSRNVYVAGGFGVTSPTFGTITPGGFGNSNFYVTRLIQSQPNTPSAVGAPPAQSAAILIPIAPAAQALVFGEPVVQGPRSRKPRA